MTETGRPTTYTPELGDAICVQLAEGISLIQICAQPDMPSKSTVLLWVVKGDRGDETYAPFSDQYRRAREAQSEALLDETIVIADDSRRDWKMMPDGEGGEREVVDHDHVTRSRLRIETRFRAMAKMHPRKYGEAQTVKHADPDGNKLPTVPVMVYVPDNGRDSTQ